MASLVCPPCIVEIVIQFQMTYVNNESSNHNICSFHSIAVAANSSSSLEIAIIYCNALEFQLSSNTDYGLYELYCIAV